MLVLRSSPASPFGRKVRIAAAIARPERAHRSRRRRHQRSRRFAAAAKSARQDPVADRRGRRSDFRQPRHPRISRLARGRGRALSQRSGGAVQGSDASGAWPTGSSTPRFCRSTNCAFASRRRVRPSGSIIRPARWRGRSRRWKRARPRLRRAMPARSPWPAPSAISICASRGLALRPSSPRGLARGFFSGGSRLRGDALSRMTAALETQKKPGEFPRRARTPRAIDSELVVQAGADQRQVHVALLPRRRFGSSSGA